MLTVVQQCGGELDAARSAGEEELAARGQREVRTQGGGDSLGGGILPPDWRAGQRIPARRPAGDESKEIIGSRSAHPSPMEGRSRLTWVGQTLTVKSTPVLGGPHHEYRLEKEAT
jgi:hypothetical protein